MKAIKSEAKWTLLCPEINDPDHFPNNGVIFDSIEEAEVEAEFQQEQMGREIWIIELDN